MNAPIRMRCSSMMEAHCSASVRVCGASGLLEDAGGADAPPPLLKEAAHPILELH